MQLTVRVERPELDELADQVLGSLGIDDLVATMPEVDVGELRDAIDPHADGVAEVTFHEWRTAETSYGYSDAYQTIGVTMHTCDGLYATWEGEVVLGVTYTGSDTFTLELADGATSGTLLAEVNASAPSNGDCDPSARVLFDLTVSITGTEDAPVLGYDGLMTVIQVCGGRSFEQSQAIAGAYSAVVYGPVAECP